MTAESARGDHRGVLEALLERYDGTAVDPARRPWRARLVVTGQEPQVFDALVGRYDATLVPPGAGAPDTELAAPPATWRRLGTEVNAGMAAHRRGDLRIRRNLHLAVSLLAATAAPRPGRLEVHSIRTAAGRISTLQAGAGEPVLMLHGLGATKSSFLPTVAALAPSHRVIAVDLPGFGDSDRPIGGAYDPAYFARAAAAVLDGLGIREAHVIGHSMGGRAALELGMRHPGRVRSLTLMTPSLAWRRPRRWAASLRLLRPELGLFHPAPTALVDPLVRRLIPGGREGWAAVAVDEFLRVFADPRGRAAFYAAARNIYLESPHGREGFWDRLPDLQPPALFIWGQRDPLVPAAFAPHVARALPQAEHLHLDCGHVPQLERPEALHGAIARFLAGHAVSHHRPAVRRLAG